MAVGRFDVYLVSLDPTVGGEIKKTRPCLIFSPVDAVRLVRKLGRLDADTGAKVLGVLGEMFAP
jgi:mRNA-degrading endonuclease toxin of MazEF toxin-antitoxin module